MSASATRMTKYQILGVTSTATHDDIRRAYHDLARQLHPDTGSTPAQEERFKRVTDAYKTLSDAALRAAYDKELADELRAAQRPSVSETPGLDFIVNLMDSYFSKRDATRPRN